MPLEQAHQQPPSQSRPLQCCLFKEKDLQMKSFNRILLTTFLGAVSVGTASADIISFTSNLVGPTPTEVAYTLNLPKFDSTLGTLTGVTLYFRGTQTSSTFTLTNTSAQNQTFDFSAQSNFVSGFTNSATAADKFTGQTLTLFDTGIGFAPGSCFAGGAPVGGCAPVTLAANASGAYAPITVNNTDAAFGFTTGTGINGLFGVVKTGTSIANYVGLGNFTLSGNTVNSTTFSGGGGNINLTQVTNGTFQAEVDYTYTVGTGAVSNPEPATMFMVGGCLLTCGLVRKRAVAV